MSKEIDLEKLSSEEIIDLFEKGFEEVAALNKIEATVTCNNRQIGKPVRVEVEVTGHAGTPTIDEFRAGSVEGSQTVKIARDDIGEKEFNLLPSETVYLSGNDYLIVYEA